MMKDMIATTMRGWLEPNPNHYLKTEKDTFIADYTRWSLLQAPMRDRDDNIVQALDVELLVEQISDAVNAGDELRVGQIVTVALKEWIKARALQLWDDNRDPDPMSAHERAMNQEAFDVEPRSAA